MTEKAERLFFFANLIAYGAGSFTGRLARGLALAATAGF